MQELEKQTIKILDIFYVPGAVYLKSIDVYCSLNKIITASFLVPCTDKTYIHFQLEYVTCEEYHHCLSQLAYVFVGLLILDNIGELDFIDFEQFKAFIVNSKMWLRQIIGLKYLKRTSKNKEFQLCFRLKEIKIYGGMHLLKITVGGALKGELEFVIPI